MHGVVKEQLSVNFSIETIIENPYAILIDFLNNYINYFCTYLQLNEAYLYLFMEVILLECCIQSSGTLD